jgi:hypothetical protein
MSFISNLTGVNNMPCKHSIEVAQRRICMIKLEDEEESYYPEEDKEVKKYCITEYYPECPRFIPNYGIKR